MPVSVTRTAGGRSARASRCWATTMPKPSSRRSRLPTPTTRTLPVMGRSRAGPGRPPDADLGQGHEAGRRPRLGRQEVIELEEEADGGIGQGAVAEAGAGRVEV